MAKKIDLTFESDDMATVMKCKISMPISSIKSEKDWKKSSEDLAEWLQLKKGLKDIKAKKILSEIIQSTAKTIARYEANKFNIKKPSPAEILNSFKEDFKLKQRDLAIYHI